MNHHLAHTFAKGSTVRDGRGLVTCGGVPNAGGLLRHPAGDRIAALQPDYTADCLRAQRRPGMASAEPDIRRILSANAVSQAARLRSRAGRIDARRCTLTLGRRAYDMSSALGAAVAWRRSAAYSAWAAGRRRLVAIYSLTRVEQLYLASFVWLGGASDFTSCLMVRVCMFARSDTSQLRLCSRQ